MRLVDTRRLMGPNHLARARLVIVDLALDGGETAAQAEGAYRRELGRMRDALKLPPVPGTIVRPHAGGVVIAYEAWIDMMLACAEMSEWAALSACEVLASREPLPLEPKRDEIADMLVAQLNPRFVALVDQARERKVPLVWDDEVVTVGTGRFAETFPQSALPDVASVTWSMLGAIPVALVTGTNGKTTTARLLARVATEAGKRVGTTSSGGITVGTEMIEGGDCSGPSAARTVLRRHDVELAVLETARGGILRRGLAVDECDVAVITNVSDDHLGLDGIDDLAGMTSVKGVVAHAVRPSGTAVLNAKDVNLVGLAGELDCNVTFFADLDGAPGPSLDAARAVLSRQRARGLRAVFAEGGMIRTARGDDVTTLTEVAAIPITFGGAARYNVENVLGVVGAASALGFPREAIVAGLLGFTNDDNPGRGQLVDRGGVSIFLDFGHNAEGVRAVMSLVSSLRAKDPRAGRLTIVTGSPGDRTDHEIASVAQILCETRPHRVFVRELSEYLRGRAPGEVPALFARNLRANGLADEALSIVGSEVEALRMALADASPGDFIAVLVHVDHAEVKAFLGV